jgi:methylmalonyl-CoA/ethylmalonyl-CoA epimerase
MNPDRYALRFHHLGLAVKAPEQALHFLRGLGYHPGPPVYDPLQQVNLILCPAVAPAGLPAVELVYPETGVASPIDRVLAKADELVYHLCFDSADPRASIEAIQRDGHRVVCVSEPKAAVLFDHREVGFWYVRGFGLIEILRQTAVPAPELR